MSADPTERRYLLVKRGLYYAPNSCGYTGFKERAGRYLETDASPNSGVTAIHEDEADEIAPNCFDDLAREYLNNKLAAQAKLIAELSEALEGTTRALNLLGLAEGLDPTSHAAERAGVAALTKAKESSPAHIGDGQ